MNFGDFNDLGGGCFFRNYIRWDWKTNYQISLNFSFSDQKY